jgi:alpha,alpha-trehalase
MPCSPTSNFLFNYKLSIIDYINRLWDILIQQDDIHIQGSSLLSLPYPYIIPGGRFHEMFYWDSYFTMLGLSISSE